MQTSTTYELTEENRASAHRVAKSVTRPGLIEALAGWKTADNDPRQAEQVAIFEYAIRVSSGEEMAQ